MVRHFGHHKRRKKKLTGVLVTELGLLVLYRSIFMKNSQMFNVATVNGEIDVGVKQNVSILVEH